MDIWQLKCFISVAKHLNFTRAAQECYTAQTTMTHQIAALERELRVKLFVRNNRNVRLTPQGELFLKEARAIIERTYQAMHIVRNASNLDITSLNVGFTGRILCNTLPYTLRELRAERPDLMVNLRNEKLGALIEMLENDVIDCFISIDFAFLNTFGWIKKQTLFEDEVMVVIPKDNPLSRFGTITSEQLGAEPFIVFEDTGVSEKYTDFATLNMPLNIYIRADSPELTECLVNSGYGLTFCLSSMANYENHFVSYVHVDPPLRMERIIACYKEDNDKPDLQVFLKKLLSFYN